MVDCATSASLARAASTRARAGSSVPTDCATGLPRMCSARGVSGDSESRTRAASRTLRAGTCRTFSASRIASEICALVRPAFLEAGMWYSMQDMQLLPRAAPSATSSRSCGVRRGMVCSLRLRGSSFDYAVLLQLGDNHIRYLTRYFLAFLFRDIVHQKDVGIFFVQRQRIEVNYLFFPD